MADDVRMSSIWPVLVAVVAAINLRLIAQGVLAFLGVWKPPAALS